jgi:hypothetical protein
MPTTSIAPQNHANFPAAGGARTAQVSTTNPVNPFNPPVMFTIYDTTQPGTVLGAGTCPYMGANPTYVPVNIPAGVPFTVHNLNSVESINVHY